MAINFWTQGAGTEEKIGAQMPDKGTPKLMHKDTYPLKHAGRSTMASLADVVSERLGRGRCLVLPPEVHGFVSLTRWEKGSTEWGRSKF